MTGKITRDTRISGEPVAAGTIIEVDEATYRQLRLCKKIEPVKARTADEPDEAKKPDPPKFKKLPAAKPE